MLNSTEKRSAYRFFRGCTCLKCTNKVKKCTCLKCTNKAKICTNKTKKCSCLNCTNKTGSASTR